MIINVLLYTYHKHLIASSVISQGKVAHVLKMDVGMLMCQR